MKPTLIALLSTVLAGTAMAERAPQPDFVTNAARRTVDRTTSTSDASREVEPFEVVPFDTNSTQMQWIDRVQLEEAVRWLRAHPNHRLVVEGHADALGSTTYNDAIATQRATVVFDALIRLGAPRARVITTSLGESMSAERIGAAQRATIVYAQSLVRR